MLKKSKTFGGKNLHKFSPQKFGMAVQTIDGALGLARLQATSTGSVDAGDGFPDVAAAVVTCAGIGFAVGDAIHGGVEDVIAVEIGSAQRQPKRQRCPSATGRRWRFTLLHAAARRRFGRYLSIGV